ncbi:hypothetical protein BTHI11S_00216 [Bosea thiooxidans]|uniref:hypothetical protein n=1 Tax=Bosea thiooxidans TaxID=53254 RepID=UPI0012E0FA47|nr:hypothetical protein [Bosea thiooxidans]
MPVPIDIPTLPAATPIETTEQFRDALERLRRIEITADGSPRQREKAELEMSICRYLVSREHRVR